MEANIYLHYLWFRFHTFGIFICGNNDPFFFYAVCTCFGDDLATQWGRSSPPVVFRFQKQIISMNTSKSSPQNTLIRDNFNKLLYMITPSTHFCCLGLFYCMALLSLFYWVKSPKSALDIWRKYADPYSKLDDIIYPCAKLNGGVPRDPFILFSFNASS